MTAFMLSMGGFCLGAICAFHKPPKQCDIPWLYLGVISNIAAALLTRAMQ